MKTDKKKSKESLIGKIIYGFLLFMPLLSVLVTCLYVIQNDNAHESYYGETINETRNENVNLADMEQNHTYYIQTTTLPADTGTLNNVTFNISYAKNLSTGYEYTSETYNRLRFFKNETKIYIQFMRVDDGASITYTDPATIQFTYQSINGPVGTISNYLQFYTIVANPSTYLDDAFMYGLYKTEESQYFNWAKNTALYTGVNEFTNALGITTTYIPFLMTYWLLISVVYLIYDIALMMLHMAHNKIHQLEGSI